ncbi:MAG TPA: hypothetical protein VGA51_15725 [Casimicrobiaceae bacterium]|jgi:hypothetical protein
MDVHISWILLAVIGVGLFVLFGYVLCHMASEQDRAARHSEKEFFPESDVTITRSGQ